MARKGKDREAAKDGNRRKKETTEEQEMFAPLKVVLCVQQQIKDFKVETLRLFTGINFLVYDHGYL